MTLSKTVENNAAFKKEGSALAGVAQWSDCQPANQWVTSSIPSLGHTPELRARSPVGGTWETTTQWHFLPLFLSPFPSLKINKILTKKRIRNSKILQMLGVFLSWSHSGSAMVDIWWVLAGESGLLDCRGANFTMEHLCKCGKFRFVVMWMVISVGELLEASLVAPRPPY